jgi:hypothetical protein
MISRNGKVGWSFALVACGAVALAAWFVADAVRSLAVRDPGPVAGPSAGEVPPADHPALASRRDPRGGGGSPILARNIFDSATGPILGTRGGGSKPRDGAAAGGAPMPGLRPCRIDGVRVVTAVASSDPGGSFALISVGPEGAGSRVYVGEGDDLGGLTVAGIGWRFVILERSPLDRCYLDLYGLDDVVYLSDARRGAVALNDVDYSIEQGPFIDPRATAPRAPRESRVGNHADVFE